jgi:hypothetical protein
VLFTAGDAGQDFYVVLDGEVAVVDERDGAERTLTTHGAGEFVGDPALLTGGIAFATAIVRRDGELLQVSAARLREVVEGTPALSEVTTDLLGLPLSGLALHVGRVPAVVVADEPALHGRLGALPPRALRGGPPSAVMQEVHPLQSKGSGVRLLLKRPR